MHVLISNPVIHLPKYILVDSIGPLHPSIKYQVSDTSQQFSPSPRIPNLSSLIDPKPFVLLQVGQGGQKRLGNVGVHSLSSAPEKQSRGICRVTCSLFSL